MFLDDVTSSAAAAAIERRVCSVLFLVTQVTRLEAPELNSDPSNQLLCHVLISIPYKLKVLQKYCKLVLVIVLLVFFFCGAKKTNETRISSSDDVIILLALNIAT